jgi:DNA-binding transcriptional LysR family regulator
MEMLDHRGLLERFSAAVTLIMRAINTHDLVSAGVGVAIVPEHFRRYKVEVVLKQLTPSLPTVTLCMVWRQNDQSPALHGLRTLIRQHFSGNTQVRAASVK